MMISAMLTSLPLPFEEAMRQAAALGFTHVDVVALADRPPAHREALAGAGVVVACASVGRELPAGATLDAGAVALRREALEIVKRQLAEAAQLGATAAYLVPGKDASAEALSRFGEACRHLAEYAAARMVRLGVEHFPGSALPSVAAVLDWLEREGTDDLGLLLDVGHCLISGEDPAESARQAGQRLVHVHFNDNDAVNDVHWPLLTGRLTAEGLQALRPVFTERSQLIGSLELNPQSAEPVEALRQGKRILERCLGGG